MLNTDVLVGQQRSFNFSQISSTKCWQLSSTSLDWLDALTVCVQQGGTLATVDNQQEQVFGFRFSVFNQLAGAGRARGADPHLHHISPSHRWGLDWTL